jgi:hypothetical protein
MTVTPASVAEALTAKLTAAVTAQKKLGWTTPAHKKKLDAAQASMAAVTTTIAASVKASAKIGAGAKAGAKTDALSLGVGVSAKTAAAVSAGVSLGIGFSASASLSAKLVTTLHSATAAVAKLNVAFSSMNAASAKVAGTNGVMPPGRAVDSGGVDSAFRELDGHLSQSQSQASALVPPTPKSPVTLEVRMARKGCWFADLATDDETPLSGKVNFEVDEKVFVGTVDPQNTGIDGSRARCRIIGGNGGLRNQISGKSYTGAAGVQVKTIVRDILHECGEDLSDLSDGTTLDQYLPRWHVSAGTGEDALTDLAKAVGAEWRVLRNGEVWFGVELWPEVTTDHRVLDEDWSNGAVTLAPDAPDLVPGVVFQGQRIEYVTHTVDAGKLRTEVRKDHPRAALDQFLSKLRRDVDYSREWPCKVITQNPDYTLQLLPDDDAMKAAGLDKVPIRYGLPGMRAKLKSGARCHLAFAAGDPKRPFAHNWEHDDEFVESVEITVGGRSAAIARVGDPVDVFFATGVPIPIVGGIGVPPAVTPIAPGTFITLTAPCQAVIAAGNGKALA